MSVLALDDRPDLNIESYTYPEIVVEEQDVEFIVEIENIVNEITGENADIPEGTEIVVALYIDGTVVVTNSSNDGLEVEESTFINLSWVAELGTDPLRDIRIEVNPSFITNRIAESNFINNFRLDSIEVQEKEPDLSIINIIVPDTIIVNETTSITATIKNSGGATDRPIYAKLNSSLEKNTYNETRKNNLPRDKTHNFTFNWIPENFGTQIISIDIFYKGITRDYQEISVLVEIEKLAWWNENWHYRYILSVNDSGTVKSQVNFTSQLNSLNIFSKTFENETIRIIQHSRNGDIISEESEYFFNESKDFDPINNAIGHLIWNVKGPTYEKFYCIYFDVKENRGIRTSIFENQSLVESGDAAIGQFSYVEGWWINFAKPMNGSFALLGQNVNFNILTAAGASSVSALIFFNENESYNFTLGFNNTNSTYWFNSTNIFDLEGNWTIIVRAEDDAGYKPEKVVHTLFVGKPDLILSQVIITTQRDPSSSTVYINDLVNFSLRIKSTNANIEDVDVLVSIFKNNNLIAKISSFITVYKDETNILELNWRANVTGKLNITIQVDPEDLIGEKNESNNEITKRIDVLSWPELGIKDIILPAYTVMEFDRVLISVVVENSGLGDGTNYLLELFIEPMNTSIVFSEDMAKDKLLINVSSNETETFNLYWSSARAGFWQVAALIVYNDTKQDTDETNNAFRLKNYLNVSGYEQNPPSIVITNINPKNQIQGGSVQIKAQITDDTGLKSVDIKISFVGGAQSEVIVDESMYKSKGNNYIYTFLDTFDVGRYNVEITAVDSSRNKNVGKKTDTFFISRDLVTPTVTFFSAEPEVQLVDNYIEINCLINNNIGISSVKVNITHIPTNKNYQKTMKLSSNGVYSSKDLYSEPGNYLYYIITEDLSGRIESTENRKIFWITPDLSDIDNDGMPNIWEEEYGLNPKYADDANEDLDDDGITNLKEYQNNCNPIKDIFSENAAFRIKENAVYLASSVVLFMVILILFLIGIRRR